MAINAYEAANPDNFIKVMVDHSIGDLLTGGSSSLLIRTQIHSQIHMHTLTQIHMNTCTHIPTHTDTLTCQLT